MNFTGEARMWHHLTYYKQSEKWDIPPHILFVLEDGFVTFLHIIGGQTVELFATRNSFQLKVADTPFLQIRVGSYLAEDTIRVH